MTSDLYIGTTTPGVRRQPHARHRVKSTPRLVAHLRYMNHTKAFWNQIDKVLPDYLERKEWLRVNGAGMDL